MRRLLIAALLVAAPLFAHPCRRAHVLIRGHNVDSNCVDGERIEDLADRYHRNVFWFSADGHSYVVTDAATLDRVAAIYAPEIGLGRQQSELGRRQATLGREQAQLGREQARLARRQARADIDDNTAEQTALAREQTELSRKESELARRQSGMAKEQSAFAEQQRVLARQVEDQLERLEDELIRRGVAHRE